MFEIIVPAYGESPYLDDCLNSIVANTTATVRCTVVDDCSDTDSIYKMVLKFNGRVNYIRNEENLGLAANFANCFNLSKSQYTVVMGSDDKIFSNFESEILGAIAKYGDPALIQPGVVEIDREGKISKNLIYFVKKIINPNKSSELKILNNKKLLRRLLIGDWLYFPSIVWRTDLARELEFDAKYKTAIDLSLLLQIAELNLKFITGAKPVFGYRRHRSSVSSKLSDSNIRTNEELDVQLRFATKYFQNKRYINSILAFTALTIRFHALVMAIKSILAAKNPSAQLISAFRWSVR